MKKELDELKAATEQGGTKREVSLPGDEHSPAKLWATIQTALEVCNACITPLAVCLDVETYVKVHRLYAHACTHPHTHPHTYTHTNIRTYMHASTHIHIIIL